MKGSDFMSATITVDNTLMSQAETIFTELGIPASTAVNMFLKSVVRCGGIPFDTRLSPNTIETLNAIDDVNHHRGLSHKFSSVDELMEDLNA